MLTDGWTPHNMHLLACIGNPDEGWLFDTNTEAQLVIFRLETDAAKLMYGMNFIVVPIDQPVPQLFFPL